MALQEYYDRLNDIYQSGNRAANYQEIAGARTRNSKNYMEELRRQQQRAIEFAVSIPKQDYQQQSIQGGGGGVGPNSFAYPLHGQLRLTSDYGPRAGHKTPHTGVDWAAASGTPIYAPADATVRSTDFNKIYGNRTVIDYGGGKASMLGHQSKIIVKPGQQVKAGQIIGYVGSTGNSTGPHLHFETWINNQPVNPLSWYS